MFAPPDLPPAAEAALRRALDDPRLAVALPRAALRAVRRDPALAGLVVGVLSAVATLAGGPLAVAGVGLARSALDLLGTPAALGT